MGTWAGLVWFGRVYDHFRSCQLRVGCASLLPFKPTVRYRVASRPIMMQQIHHLHRRDGYEAPLGIKTKSNKPTHCPTILNFLTLLIHSSINNLGSEPCKDQFPFKIARQNEFNQRTVKPSSWIQIVSRCKRMHCPSRTLLMTHACTALCQIPKFQKRQRKMLVPSSMPWKADVAFLTNPERQKTRSQVMSLVV